MSYIDPDLLSGALNNLITFVGDNGTTLSAKGVDRRGGLGHFFANDRCPSHGGLQ
jgi:hypothetical protein